MNIWYVLDGHTPTPTDDLQAVAAQMENADARRVDHTSIGDVDVSTVFLGLDHGFGGTPLWFETMVFGGPLDQEMDRYTHNLGRS